MLLPSPPAEPHRRLHGLDGAEGEWVRMGERHPAKLRPSSQVLALIASLGRGLRRRPRPGRPEDRAYQHRPHHEVRSRLLAGAAQPRLGQVGVGDRRRATLRRRTLRASRPGQGTAARRRSLNSLDYWGAPPCQTRTHSLLCGSLYGFFRLGSGGAIFSSTSWRISRLRFLLSFLLMTPFPGGRSCHLILRSPSGVLRRCLFWLDAVWRSSSSF